MVVGHPLGALAEERVAGEQRLGAGNDDADDLETQPLDVPWREAGRERLDQVVFGAGGLAVAADVPGRGRVARDDHELAGGADLLERAARLLVLVGRMAVAAGQRHQRGERREGPQQWAGHLDSPVAGASP